MGGGGVEMKRNFEMLLIPLSMKFQFCIGIKGNTCMLQVYVRAKHMKEAMYRRFYTLAIKYDVSRTHFICFNQALLSTLSRNVSPPCRPPHAG